MNRYVIIGNGAAAAGCIEGIRSVDTEGAITVVSGENHPVYCRPLISYYLEGKTDLARIHYREPDFYEKMGCRVLYGRRAVELLPDAKSVELDDGTRLSYTRLCLATGSSPFVPPFPGLESVDRQHAFLTLDDALELERDLTPDSRVLIVGAGLIGLKCAEGIRDRVKSVTVCDLADRVLSSILDHTCARMMQRHLEAHGIRFYLSDSVSRFDGNTAYLKSGGEIPFDVLVLAVGVRANTGLLRAIGAEVNRGAVVDDSMRTSVEDIYAAGDCTEGFDCSSGQRRVLAILPNAVMQGHTAGVNMAGGQAAFDKGMPMNSIGFFGLHAMTAGTYEGELYGEVQSGSIKRLYIRDDVLKGFLLIGCQERAGIYTRMIREQTPLSSVNFQLLQQSATTAAFSQQERSRMFGGVV